MGGLDRSDSLLGRTRVPEDAELHVRPLFCPTLTPLQVWSLDSGLVHTAINNGSP
jgi:hypothetical protein